MKGFIIEQCENELYAVHTGLALVGLCLDKLITMEKQLSKALGRCKGISFLDRVLQKARRITNRKLLVRLDSAHDSVETRMKLEEYPGVYYVLKWNPRNRSSAHIASRVFKEGKVTKPRPSKRVGLLTIKEKQEYEGKVYTFAKVIRVTERVLTRHGQVYLLPEIQVEGWWTNLDLSGEEVIELYEGHGLCEQFHSEFKSDLDIERLPSGKFATNALVMSLAVLAYNILRYIGLMGLLGDISPVRHPAKKRRIKTVIQELIYLACRMIKSGRRYKLKFGRCCSGDLAFGQVYNLLAIA